MPSTKWSFMRFAYCRSGRKVINGNLRAESARPAQESVLEVSPAFLNEPGRTSRPANRQPASRPSRCVFFIKSGTFFRARRVHAERSVREHLGRSARVAHLQESTDQPTSLLQSLLLDADSRIAAFYSPCTGWAAFCCANDITLAAAMAACFSSVPTWTVGWAKWMPFSANACWIMV